MSDKNEAIIQYLIQCPQIINSPLYFNFTNASDNDKQIATLSNDTYMNRPYIDGSVLKLFTFTIYNFTTISDEAIVKLSGYSNENVEELKTIQDLMNWVNEQNDLQNFPDFGETCKIQSIKTTADNPNLEGINVEVNPPLAVYSLSIQIEYLDISKQLWR